MEVLGAKFFDNCFMVPIINGWRRFECEGINHLLIGLLVQFVIFWKNNGILLPMFELSL